MNKQHFVKQLFPRMIMTSLFAVIFLPVQSTSANDLLRDVGISAGTNVVTGEVLNNGSTVGNAVKGAASGAAVNVTRDQNNDSVGGTIQDAGVGAAANIVTGVIIDDGSVLGNGISGAATGTLINILD